MTHLLGVGGNKAPLFPGTDDGLAEGEARSQTSVTLTRL